MTVGPPQSVTLPPPQSRVPHHLFANSREIHELVEDYFLLGIHLAARPVCVVRVCALYVCSQKTTARYPDANYTKA